MSVEEVSRWYEIIFNHITKVSFSSAVYSDHVLLKGILAALPLMKDAISSRNVNDVSIRLVMDIAYKVTGESINKLKKEDERRLCFEVAFIMLYNFITKAENGHLMFEDVPTLLHYYPEFEGVEESELKVLLTFRNVMKVAQLVIPAKNHKNHLLDLTTRIAEGKNQKYVTGSGQTVSTSRRVLIYETEGGVKPTPRPPRARKNKLDELSELACDLLGNKRGALEADRLNPILNSLGSLGPSFSLQSNFSVLSHTSNNSNNSLSALVGLASAAPLYSSFSPSPSDQQPRQLTAEDLLVHSNNHVYTPSFSAATPPGISSAQNANSATVNASSAPSSSANAANASNGSSGFASLSEIMPSSLQRLPSLRMPSDLSLGSEFLVEMAFSRGNSMDLSFMASTLSPAQKNDLYHNLNRENSMNKEVREDRREPLEVTQEEDEEEEEEEDNNNEEEEEEEEKAKQVEAEGESNLKTE